MESESKPEFRSCSSGHTKCVGSIYHRDKVPIEMFEKSDGEYYKSCSDCRKHNATQQSRIKKKNSNKIREELIEKDPESEFRSCTNDHTKRVNSIYPKDKVPIEMFKKLNGQYYTNCSDCRKYTAVESNVRKNKKMERDKIKKEQVEAEFQKEFSFCPHTGHSTVVKSSHPQNLVPISFFRMEPNNPKSELFVNCLDCRRYMKGYRLTNINNIKSLSEDKELYACVSCHKLIEHCDRAMNLDGTLSVRCIPCKEDNRESYAKRKQHYIDIKFEFIEKYQCSCYDCKFLFLKPNDDSIIVSKIPTYEKCGDVNRYALIDDKEMHVKDIIKLYHDDLEVSIIELDHLPEKDQRERGLLLPNEIYVPKKKNICDIASKASIKLEALKCQHLCILCHLKKTIEREKGTNHRSSYNQEKLDYTNKLKLQGCEVCEYKNSDLPRFFDMDHLDISEKKASVGNMCGNSDYSLDDVIKECRKCRILCKHCHKIHTAKQTKQGLFLPIGKNIFS